MEEQLLGVFRSVFNHEDPTSITLESEFREFEQYSSLTQMTLIAEIQEKMHVKLKLLGLIKAETIGDVMDAIENN